MKRITVTVGIIVFNEEANIKKLLLNVLGQKGQFSLEKIIVVSDGSTDRTIKILKSFKNKKLQVVDSKNNSGKAARLNYLFKQNKSDVLVLFDGDVLPKDNLVIAKLLKQFKPGIGLIGGEVEAFNPETLTEKTHIHSSLMLKRAIKNFKRGDSIFNCQGAILALKKDFLKGLSLPKYTLNDDCFIYMHTEKTQLKFKYAPLAKVLFRPPQTFSDYLKQHSRYHSSKGTLTNHFGEIIAQKYYIPKKEKIFSYALGLRSKPLLTIGFFFYESLVRLNVFFNRKNIVWSPIKSTKYSIGDKI